MPLWFMLLSVEGSKQTSPSRAHLHEQPCGFHGAVTALNVSRFYSSFILTKAAEAQARFFVHHSTVAFGSYALSLVKIFLDSICYTDTTLLWEAKG